MKSLAPSLSGEGLGRGHSRRQFLQAAAGSAAALLVPAAVQAQGKVERFTTAPSLPAWQSSDLDGKPVAIPAAGKPTVVNFWASWCEPCRAEMPLLQQMADFYSDKLVFQAVNFKERAAAVQKHVRSSNWAIPVVLDPTGNGAQAWNVKVFPTTVGFDAQGRARWRVTGEYDWSSAEAGKLVEALWS